MQTDSINRPKARDRGPLRLCCLALVLACCGGCFLIPKSVVVEDLLEPIAARKRWLPAPGDLASARLARKALIAKPTPGLKESDPNTASPALETALEDLKRSKLSEDDDDVIPLAIDLRNATLDDPIAYRAGSRKLRSRRGLDPRIKSRLDRTIDDDPIRLAKRRQFDGWHLLWARTFNTISEPLGSTLITGFVLAPYQLANSIIHYFADFSNNEALSLTDRQALTLRQDFLLAHPDTELTIPLEKKIEKSELLLAKTLALRRVRAAERAFDAGGPALALHQAKVAIKILTEYPEEYARLRKRAYRIESKAAESLALTSRYRIESLGARRSPESLQEAERALAAALIGMPRGSNEIEAQIADYQAIAGNAGDGRIEFIRALEQHEIGFDFDALKRLRKLAVVNPERDTMARHAKTLVDDDWQNPHGAFERLKRVSAREELAWRLAGEWVRRTRYPNLPTPIAYLVDAPTIALTIILAPLRALISPWTGSPDFRRAPALAGYRYLIRYPDGGEQQSVVNWLYDYESALKRWGRALRLADLKSDFDPEKRAELVEKTAEERVAQVEQIDRRDSRASLLKGVAREFPDSEGGHEAGLQARLEFENASPQHIRITKSFLLENPVVAGRHGVGLNPKLLNGDDADGELHPDGVMLRGGRILEIFLIGEGSDKKGPADSRTRRISKERLIQIASSLDEAVQRNSLIDVEARFASDPSRDVYLEKASLGLTEEVDRRPTAESNFVYQSLRERYGLVRGRDSVLPFDLVLRGNLGDFTLGAFPRWRAPRATPDAFLYR
jgi:hypothetical protein